MSMTTDQSTRLEATVAALNAIDGVDSVQSDDFDSYYVNVFIYLTPDEPKPWFGVPVYKWAKPLRSTKAAIRRVLKEQGIEDYHFLDQPEKQREYNGKMYGKTLWFDKGYDTDNIKIEIPYPV